jgi:ElaB/YqjD/DUF883 family membrane-anchored ribosome-binding protein
MMETEMETEIETATAPDVTALQTELAQLQEGLAAAVEEVRRIGGQLPNGHDTAFVAAGKMWTEAKRQVQQVGHEIEERPLVSAATAFGAGMAIGMLFSGRRG